MCVVRFRSFPDTTSDVLSFLCALPVYITSLVLSPQSTIHHPRTTSFSCRLHRLARAIALVCVARVGVI